MKTIKNLSLNLLSFAAWMLLVATILTFATPFVTDWHPFTTADDFRPLSEVAPFYEMVTMIIFWMGLISGAAGAGLVYLIKTKVGRK